VAKRKRRKRRTAGEEYIVLIGLAVIAIVLIVSALVWVASVLWKPLLGVVAIAALVICGALLLDAAAFAYARSRGRETQGLRATTPLVAAMQRATRSLHEAVWPILGWPLRLFREPRIRARTLSELLMLSPSQFESAIAQLFRDSGYRHVKMRGGSGDLGVDITCDGPNGERVAVQCKRYAPGKPVGSPVIQSFIGMATTHHRVDRGIVVTTSNFTEPARKLAKQHRIRLIDGDELARIIGSDAPPLAAAQRGVQPIEGRKP
jgi:hypothetical protein